MSFAPIPFHPSIPLMATHGNYPGSWTWQSAADEPIGNPGAYYYGDHAASWGLYGMGAVSDEKRRDLELAVENVEELAQNPPPGLPRQQFAALVGDVREELRSTPAFESSGALSWIGFGSPSSSELLERLNAAHAFFIASRPEPGEVSISPRAIDSTGRAREDSPWGAAADSFLDDMTDPRYWEERREELAPKLAIGGAGLAALAIGGVLLYGYVSGLGRGRAAGR